jgi:glycosyltransferase involved in cell wall biosynthesis
MNCESPSTLSVSVVIPCLNVEEVLSVQLEAAAGQRCSEPWEVIVVDNGSTDRTREIAESFRSRLPQLRILSVERRGRHHACNAGAIEARGRSVIFVDADDEMAPGFLEAMRRGLDEHEFVGGRLEHARLNPPVFRNVTDVQCEGLMHVLGFYPFVSGAAMGVRRHVFQGLRGFDDKPFCEDVDFSWRAQLKGVRPVFLPEAVVHYRQRSGYYRMFQQHRRYGAAQALLYRDFQVRGMPSRKASEVALDWLAIGKTLLVLAREGPDVRLRWVRRSGRAIGRVLGSVKHGVFYF